MALVFLLLFVFSFVVRVFTGTGAYNGVRTFTDQPPFSTVAFLQFARFWLITLQSWRVEYLVIAIYVVLTIFLRQEDLPESRQVDVSNTTTGPE